MNATELEPRAYPPETLEGWYALHQIFTIDGSAAPKRAVGRRTMKQPATSSRVDSTHATSPDPLTALVAPSVGWSAAVRLIGSSADVMVVHFRESLDAIGAAQAALAAHPAAAKLQLRYSFLSVTEAGLYHLTAQLAREAAERGGAVGDETYAADLARRVVAERENPHVRRRLYPSLPDGMPYLCFYPMSKRRDAGQNWYSLTLDERSRLMYAHALTGRRYAGRVLQIITGAIGFDAWEWGVTLFAKDPLDFKKLVGDMRFDEVSAKYAEFGDFYVGRVMSIDALETLGALAD